jgi:FMN phosphatase YigB (HAD superfamily)
LLQNPYWRLHLRPWLEDLAPKELTSPADLWRLMLQESQRRLSTGRHSSAYDWQDIARQCLGVWLPDPPLVSREQILPLVYPDVWDFLRWLDTSRYSAVIVTNGLSRNQVPYLRSLGWDGVFRKVVGAESGWAKPDPRIFSATPDIAAHIGDRIAHDVLGAQRAHIVAIHLQRRNEPESREGWDPLSPAAISAHFAINSLIQVPEVLEQYPANW